MLVVFQIFISQISMFYAQWIWMSPYHAALEEGDDSDDILEFINGPAIIWIKIETCAYYSYIFSACCYIFWSSTKAAWENN